MNKLAILLIAAASLSPAFAQATQPQNNGDETAATSSPSTSGKPMQDRTSQAPQNVESPKAIHRKHRKHRMHPKKALAPPATPQNVAP